MLSKNESLGSEGWGQNLFSGAQWQDKEKWAKTGGQEIPPKCEEKIPCRQGTGALEKVAQISCGISFSEDSKLTWLLPTPTVL